MRGNYPAPDVLDEALGLMCCPVCGEGLARAGGAVRCGAGHSFDVARQGYLSLLAGERASGRGDTAAMVAARERFLAGGHFEPLVDGLAPPGGWPAAPVVDLGAGTGWYLARALERLPDAIGVALDVSKPALRRAARAHPRLAAVACDAWGELPLRDGVAGAVLNAFAPRNLAEIARILAPHGTAVIVTAASAHLAELREPLGLLGVEASKQERLDTQLASHLRVAERRELSWPLRLDRAAARDLAGMGPSAFHTDPAALDERIASLRGPLRATAAVTITHARPR
jgi:23S rRNA (guanine745-N1)-methyltransferase